MRYQYVVILKRTSERATDLMSILLCLFSAISYIFFGISSFYKPESARLLSYTLFLAAAILLTGLAVNGFLRRKRQVRYRYLLALAGLVWLSMTYFPWAALFFFLLAFLEDQTKRPLEIGFDKDLVVINSLIKRRLAWSAFNNVILKDGLLTLDFKNNRLLQKEVADDEDEDDTIEEEFNTYCRERLTSVSGF